MTIDISTHKTILFQILKDIYQDTTIAPFLGFKGGTAALMFYGLNRFSVDLDFDLLDDSKEGVTFQFYSQIFVASYLTREITIDDQLYSFRKIRNLLLMNSIGVELKDESSLATKERAFLDTLYLHTDYHFDNLDGVDWEKVFEILPIFGNKRMDKKVKELYQHVLDAK